MSQLDVSIFYSHLFGLLLVIYIFIHLMVIVIVKHYYNIKLRAYSEDIVGTSFQKVNSIGTLMRILQ